MLMTICLMGCIAALTHVLVERQDVREEGLQGGIFVVLLTATAVMLLSL